MLGRQLTRSLALVLLGCALVGAICRGAEAEDRRLGAANDLLQLAQTRSREPEAKKEAPHIDATKRQALLKRRVEQLRKAGKHDAAISTARRSLALAEQRHGHEHPSVATALTTLGGLYARLHRLSRKPNRPISAHWTFAKSRWDPDHPDTVASLNNLAGLYQDAGQTRLSRAVLQACSGRSGEVTLQRPEHCTRRGGRHSPTWRPSINPKAAPQRRRNSPSKHTPFAEKKSEPSNEIGMLVRRRRSAREDILPADKSLADNPRRASSQMQRRNRT